MPILHEELNKSGKHANTACQGSSIKLGNGMPIVHGAIKNNHQQKHAKIVCGNCYILNNMSIPQVELYLTNKYHRTVILGNIKSPHDDQLEQHANTACKIISI